MLLYAQQRYKQRATTNSIHKLGAVIMENKIRAPQNRTITLTQEEFEFYGSRLMSLTSSVNLPEVLNRTICQDVFIALDFLPERTVDLVIADPPYNLTKSFNSTAFKKTSAYEYEKWLNQWLPKVARVMKPTASIYICGDWRSSGAIQKVSEQLFNIQNRITWEREKGRGAKSNWKNCSEDIWFCTSSDKYTFNVEDVKLKRRVIAPYTNEQGVPKDWSDNEEGRFRLTYPSNLWTDITIPFWSMPENTDHPTQKPEKLLAKLILASTNLDDVILDPFLGSGTTSVVAKKLGRSYIGVEVDYYYSCIAEYRLQLASKNRNIQGYTEGVFWERNTMSDQNKVSSKERIITTSQSSLFSDFTGND